MTEYSIVGKNIPKVDAEDKVTGRAKYAGDLHFPGMLSGKILRSPYPHAKILKINTEKASKLVGVKAILTGKDTLGIRMGNVEVVAEMADRYPLAMDKVRFVGNEVAAVAAVDEETAEEALTLIEVEYEELPAVFDPEEAMVPGAPKVHDVENNIGLRTTIEVGDVEKAFREAYFVHESKYRTHLVVHCALEPHAAAAKFENGNLTLWSSTQSVFVTRYWIARTLGLPEGRVRVIKPFVGGGFGGKLDTFSHEFCCGLLSMKTGKPVKIVLTRKEVFIATRTRHPMILEMKTGVKKDGTITGKQCRHILDGGAYGGAGVAAANLSLVWANFPYKIPNIKMEAFRVYTNNPVAGAMRGYGSNQVHFAGDSHMDEIAKALNMDPLELRLKNAMTPNYVTPSGLKITSCGFSETLQEAGKAVRWERRKEGLPKGKGLGLGCSGFVSGTAFAILTTPKNYSSFAIVKLHRQGFATVYTGTNDIGQGSDTTLTMIAAEELGLRMEDVKIVSADTEITPFDSGTYGSRVTFLSGNAVRRAAADAKRQLFEAVGEKMEADPRDLELRDRRVFVKGSPEKGMSFEEAIWTYQESKGGDEVVGKGTFYHEWSISAFRTNLGNYAPTYSFSTGATEVEVDKETGLVSVPNIVFTHDIGFPINPQNVEGQIEGSIQMGLGFTLYEQCQMKEGKMLNPSFRDYKLPTALDMPKIKIILINSNDPDGPFGAKECGEGSTAPVAPSIANAIYNATGVRFHDLPITPEKVLKALKEKG